MTFWVSSSLLSWSITWIDNNWLSTTFFSTTALTALVQMTNLNPGERLNSWELLAVSSLSCWSFLLSSDIDLLLRQLVWAYPFYLLILSPPCSGLKLSENTKDCPQSKDAKLPALILPLLWSATRYRGYWRFLQLMRLNHPLINPS